MSSVVGNEQFGEGVPGARTWKGSGLVADHDGASRVYRTLKPLIAGLANAIYRPWTEGFEHIPDSGAAILASNHVSFLDSVFLPALCDRPIYFLGKADYFEDWRRPFFESVGVLPVNRGGGDAGDASLRAGADVLERGHLLGIYPEGTRSPDGRMYRGKTGPVRLALRTGAPIIPVAMIGVRDILPPDKAVPKVARFGIRIGPALDFAARYGGREINRLMLRSATDELMYELMMLSGQEYVDEYAALVKSGEVAVQSHDLDELGEFLDDTDGLTL